MEKQRCSHKQVSSLDFFLIFFCPKHHNHAPTNTPNVLIFFFFSPPSSSPQMLQTVILLASNPYSTHGAGPESEWPPVKTPGSGRWRRLCGYVCAQVCGRGERKESLSDSELCWKAGRRRREKCESHSIMSRSKLTQHTSEDWNLGDNATKRGRTCQRGKVWNLHWVECLAASKHRND